MNRRGLVALAWVIAVVVAMLPIELRVLGSTASCGPAPIALLQPAAQESREAESPNLITNGSDRAFASECASRGFWRLVLAFAIGLGGTLVAARLGAKSSSSSDVLAQLRGLHHPVPINPPPPSGYATHACLGCDAQGRVAWPCPTAQLIGVAPVP